MKWSPPQDSHLPSVVAYCLVVLDISALAELRGEGLPLVKICAQHAISMMKKICSHTRWAEVFCTAALSVYLVP